MSDLAEAITAYQNGATAASLRIARTILSKDPENAGAYYLIGVIHADSGELSDATISLQRAIQISPSNSNFHITLGNCYLKLEQYKLAAETYKKATTINPLSAPAHTNLATALKREGDLPGAVEEYKIALNIFRRPLWKDPPDLKSKQGQSVDPSQMHTYQFASPAKLIHDIEQYEYLVAKSLLPKTFKKEIESHRSVLLELLNADLSTDLSKQLSFSPSQQKRIFRSFNRLNYLPPDSASSKIVLNPELNYEIISRNFNTNLPKAVVIDNFLTDQALKQLWQYCLDATIWFDCKENGGYLGAYLNEGFHSQVLFNLAKNLRTSFPNIFKGHKLTQLWAFKYNSEGFGTRLHADQAAININFWITPDSSKLKESSGGLRLYNISAPSHWHFDKYNYEDTYLLNEIKQRSGKPQEIAYKCNRAVIFDSSLIHETSPISFKKGYENRRINVTMLFGNRAES